MSKRLHLPCVLAVILLLGLAAKLSTTAAAPHNGDASVDRAAVNKVLAGLIAADDVGNLDAVIASYAEDAVLLPPHAAAVAGKPAIRARYEETFRHFRFDIAFSADETEAFGDWAFIRGAVSGRLIPKADESLRTLHDKYIMVLQRHKDGWKIARLIWNTSDSSSPTAK